MNKKVKVGLIGAGRIGRLHGENILRNVPDAEVTAVADVIVEPCQKWAEEVGIETVYQQYDDLLSRSDIDAVLICSATPTHKDIAIKAAKAGKHIFCEKPVDMSLPNIQAIKRAVEESGVIFQVGFNRRFDHNFSKVEQRVSEGAIGSVHTVKITSRDPAPPPIEYIKISGGIFMDMSIHDFDMARFLAGSEVTEVYAESACLVDSQIGEVGDADTAIITLKFENGALGVIDNSRQALYGYDQRIEVFGSKGVVLAENDTPTTVKVATEEGVVGDKPLHFFLERYMDAYTAEIKSFLDSLKEGKPAAVGIDDGLMSVKIALAANHSNRERRPVSLSEIV